MTKSANLNERARRVVVQRLENLQRAGLSHLPKTRRDSADQATGRAEGCSPEAAPQPCQPSARQASSIVAAKSLFDAAASEQRIVSPADRPAALELIRGEVVACTRCKELASGRTQTVF